MNKNLEKTPKLNSLYEKIDLYDQPTWIVSTVAKEDLNDYFTREEIEQLDDEDMSQIAKKLGDAIMETGYWECLEGVSEYIKERKKK